MQEDITGKKFNRLTAIKFIKRKDRNYYWQYRCDCGNKIIVQKQGVTFGNTKSCGCLQKEIISKRSKKHGLYGTKFYRVYRAMKDRCENKNDKGYQKWYGSRGIKCLWNRFEDFRDDMYLMIQYLRACVCV